MRSKWPAHIIIISILLSVIRSYGHCQLLSESLTLSSALITDLQEKLKVATPEEQSSIYSRLYRVYSAEIEVNCHNNKGEEALKILHTMSSLASPPLPIPRSCYMMLFSYYSLVDQAEHAAVKDKLLEMCCWWMVIIRVTVCESSGCNKEEVFNHYILALMKVHWFVW